MHGPMISFYKHTIFKYTFSVDTSLGKVKTATILVCSRTFYWDIQLVIFQVSHFRRVTSFDSLGIYLTCLERSQSLWNFTKATFEKKIIVFLNTIWRTWFFITTYFFIVEFKHGVGVGVILNFGKYLGILSRIPT